MDSSIVSYILISGGPFIFGLLALFVFKPTKAHVKFLLSFSGAFILGISTLHLLPEIFEGAPNNFTAGIFLLSGFLLQLFLEFFSKGIEHGHVHVHNHGKKLFPLVIFGSLCLHAFIEGMPINYHQHLHSNHLESNSLLYGILMHKLPISVTLVGFLLSSGVSKIRTIIVLLIFVLMAPLGMLLSESISSFSHYFHYSQAFVVGMLLHISTTILFEASDGHKFNLLKLSAIIIGILLAFVSI